MTRALIILDPNLKNLLGHYFEYDRSVGEAALLKGLECIILAHRQAALPPGLPFTIHSVYSSDIWKSLPGETYHTERNITAVSAAFTSETLEFLTSRPLNRGDILFLPTIAKAQLPGAAALAEGLGPRGAHLHIMLRYQHAFYDGPIAATAFLRLEEVAKDSSISLCTDSHRLARDLGTLTVLPIHVLPIPHTDHLVGLRHPPPEPTGRIHFVSLGNARGEKGLAEILDAVRESTHKPWGDRARFTLQCNDPSADVVDAIRAFRKTPDPRVTLADRILSSDEYYALLQQADVVLVPYHRGIYRERTSGVFLEAITAGKIVVCTQDTWMNDLLDECGGGIAVADRSATDLCSAIGEIIADFSNFQKRALTAAAHWKKIHSSDNLVAHLLGEVSNLAIGQVRTKAAVIYPWGDAVDGNSGAAVRLKLLVKYLEQRYGEVRVLFTAVGERGGRMTARTIAEPYHFRIRTRFLYATLAFFSLILGGKKGQSFHLWFHLWPWIDFRFHARCEEMIRWTDDVYLEYSYFAPVVGRLCRRFGKRLVVTQHDIVSEQSKGVPLVHGATRMLEFGALKGASRVILCTEDERVLCEARGIAAELIPHPIDVNSRIVLTAEDAAFILNTLYAVQTEGRQICFFVGSAYGPNRKAGQFIRAMAARFRDDSRARDVLFVVAGACMEPEHGENFIALGMIEEAGLSCCYDMAAIVLVPVTEGTGSAIKSIESMARGAVVLSTSVGMRGIPVEPGRHCLIEDDLSLFPEQILKILNDRKKADRVRAEARSFGAAYDYRLLFARYALGRSDSKIVSVEQLDDELKERRRKAIRELLPRLQQLQNPHARQLFLSRFDLAQEEPAILVEPKRKEQGTGRATAAQITAPTAEEVSRAPGRPPEIAPPARRSKLRRIAKRTLLLFPPLRFLYQELLFANARNAELIQEKQAWREQLRTTNAVNENVQCKLEGLGERVGKVLEHLAELKAQNEALERRQDEIAAVAAEAGQRRLEGLGERVGQVFEHFSRIENHFKDLEHGIADQRRSLDMLRSFASTAISVPMTRLEYQVRDILELVLSPQRIPELGWSIVAERSLAIDSNDHLFPRGTKNDNTHHPRFVRACEALLGPGIKHMDLGCAGGGLVWDFTRRGHRSVGVEGSDYNLRAQRAEWRTIPDRLFTADVCYPFGFKNHSGSNIKFDIISAWELFEHIPEENLSGLLANITSNIRTGGYVAASIATFIDRDETTGKVYHHTVRPREWWENKFKRVGLIPVDGVFAKSDFVRGGGNPTSHDWDAHTNPEMGFHIVLRFENDCPQIC
jgi:glycosyltransferase involved in cell wall biosynthesis/2-polyprenyl-3-methyl-5-hydroxy-6-metoxy-1,4-benzoquinol methylase